MEGQIMKKLSLLFGVLFLASVLNARGNQGQSDLNVRLWNNAPFKIILNNQGFNRTTNFQTKNIRPGYHSIKIMSIQPNRNGNGGFNKVLYRGDIKVPANSKVVATVTPNQRIKLNVVKKQRVIRRNGHRNNRYNNGYGNNVNYNNTGYNNYGNNDPLCNVNNNYGSQNYVMSNVRLDQLIYTMDEAHFDSAKLAIAKQAIHQNNFTTRQVALIMRAFTFESNRLKFAKLAFDKTIDQENYFLVNNELTYNSSIANLNDYINRYI